jgi:hypothetical protein
MTRRSFGGEVSGSMPRRLSEVSSKVSVLCTMVYTYAVVAFGKYSG